MSDTRLAEGIKFFDKNDRAPDFVLGNLSIDQKKFSEWVSGEEPDGKGYIRLKILRAKSGIPYIAIDDWKPNNEKSDIPVVDNDDPF